MKKEHSPKSYRIYLVDDHEMMRYGMRRLIEEEGWVVCGESSDASHTIQFIEKSKPDAVLIDLGLKGTSGLDLIKHLKQILPKLPILVISMYEESLYADRVLKAGAKGYIMKQAPAEAIMQALHQVVLGKIYLSQEMSEKMLQSMGHSSSAQEGVSQLSDRELDVFRMIGKGLKTSEIAEAIHLSVKTIETYREQIKLKLNLKTASELNQYAIEWLRTTPL
jgi:DNA-binding NarL/FixJ family response regulator